MEMGFVFFEVGIESLNTINASFSFKGSTEEMYNSRLFYVIIILKQVHRNSDVSGTVFFIKKYYLF
jgi:hypothetical protein